MRASPERLEFVHITRRLQLLARHITLPRKKKHHEHNYFRHSVNDQQEQSTVPLSRTWHGAVDANNELNTQQPSLVVIPTFVSWSHTGPGRLFRLTNASVLNFHCHVQHSGAPRRTQRSSRAQTITRVNDWCYKLACTTQAAKYYSCSCAYACPVICPK